MDSSTLWIILIVVALALIFLVLWFRRDRRKQPPAWLRPEEANTARPPEESAAEIVEAAIDRGPVIAPAPEGPPDELTRMKGVGPKVAALLADMGVTHFSQIAAWSEADVAAIDARLGAFQGRITRDRWVEQADFLARGDTAGFEAKFGKLG